MRDRSAANATPSPSAKAAPSALPDAELLALARKAVALARRLELLSDDIERAEAGRALPDRPEELTVRPGDRITAARPGERIGPDVVDGYREMLAENLNYPAPIVARMREVIRAENRWSRALAAANRAAGVTRARRRHARALEQKKAIFAAVGRMQAHTAAGILAKLLIAAPDVVTFVDEFDDDGQVEFVLASAARDAKAIIVDDDARGAFVLSVLHAQARTS